MIFSGMIEKVYRRRLYVRCDDTGTARYFGPEDFPGLKWIPCTFPSSMGHTLKGGFYSYNNPDYDRIVVFDHGMGGGHRSYMREIERLARAGYLVFSYDHTGCMESGGENTNGFAQSLRDLNDCLTFLTGMESMEKRNIAVMGHSWGGFSTMNIAALHPQVSHVIAVSGFVSVKAMVEQNFDGLLKGYRKGLLEMERKANPEYIHYNAVKSLKNTAAKVLLIYSADDPVVKREHHFDILKRELSHRENIRFLLTDGKGHNPNYTKEAAQYLQTYQLELTRKLKKLELGTAEERKAFVDSYDWKRMTEQDEAVWTEILNTLEA